MRRVMSPSCDRQRCIPLGNTLRPSKKHVSVRIDVKRRLLDWAITRSGKSVDDLSKNRTICNIRKWLSGESRPTLSQLETFANATFTPLGYLLLSDPPDEPMPIPYFRTLGKTPAFRPSLDLMDTIQIIKQRQDWMRDHLVAGGSHQLHFVGSVKQADLPVDIARDMRKMLGMTGEWAAGLDSWEKALMELRSKIEESGVFVTTNGIVGYNTRRRLQVDEFRGFVLVDDHAPFIFVNGADSKSAQMFTLAHELAHVWLGRSATFDLRYLDPANDAVERACNMIAAEFLVPEDEMHPVWDRFAANPDPYKGVARHFKVSRLVAARRALDLGFIHRDEFLDSYGELYKETRKGKGGDFYAVANLRIGERFARAVISAAREEKILYREAYNLTGLNRSTFEKYAALLGLGEGK